MDPLGVLRREHQAIQKRLSELDEMTYSMAVNVRDLSFSFREVLRLLEKHEEKEELLLEILSQEGISVSIESLNTRYGELKEKMDVVLEVLEGGDEREIKEILHGACGELIDRIKAHIYAEENVFSKINWSKVDKRTLDKIGLLQIIPSRKLL